MVKFKSISDHPETPSDLMPILWQMVELTYCIEAGPLQLKVVEAVGDTDFVHTPLLLTYFPSMIIPSTRLIVLGSLMVPVLTRIYLGLPSMA